MKSPSIGSSTSRVCVCIRRRLDRKLRWWDDREITKAPCVGPGKDRVRVRDGREYC